MKRLKTILIWIAFLIGLGIFSYPAVSNWVAERNQIIATQSYINQITTLSPSQIKEEWQKAKKYNSLLEAGIVTDPFSDVEGIEPFTEYDKTLDIDGIMGYVSIPTIQAKVTIYHGVSDEVLRKGAGHIKATALPIGGKGTHSVLSSHSGLPEARLFTDLEKLEQGDYFYNTCTGQRACLPGGPDQRGYAGRYIQAAARRGRGFCHTADLYADRYQ